jgi:nucleotide-binding universal stress UspA family protein
MLVSDARAVADAALETVHGVAHDLEVHASTPLEDARAALIEASHTASMVAVGTRGRGSVKALLLGSVSTAVAAHASSPVAVVRPGSGRTDATDGHVVVGVDAGPSSTRAVELAFQIASTEGRPLDVVFGWPSVDTYDDWHPYDQHLETPAEHRLALSESVAGFSEKYPDVHVTQLTPELPPVQALVEQSKSASLVVVGTRGLTGVQAVFGSVSREVLERAHCTVLVVRP